MRVADVLLSGRLTRLAVTRHCELGELLARIGVDIRQVGMPDSEIAVAVPSGEDTDGLASECRIWGLQTQLIAAFARSQGNAPFVISEASFDPWS